MGLSVVIPALDEEDAIAGTIANVSKHLGLASIEHEIIVVDDGSTDRTGELARTAGAKVIRHVHNLGYGRSLKDGIAAASHPDIVITDADGTYPIHEIPRLYELYQQGFDMVVGQRTGPEFHESALKSPLRSILKAIVEFTAGRKIPDINSGLRIFSRDKSLRYLDRLCDTFSFTTSLTLAFMMNGLYVKYLPTEYYARTGQTKVRLWRDSLRTIQYIAESAIYYNPMKVFLFASMVLMLFGAGLSVLNLFLGRTGILLAIIAVFLAAIIVFAFGLLAVLLKQILDRMVAMDERSRAAPSRFIAMEAGVNGRNEPELFRIPEDKANIGATSEPVTSGRQQL